MLTAGSRAPALVASTKLEKGLRAMTMKERLAVHRQIEAENKHKMIRFCMEQLNRGDLKEWGESK